MPTILFVLALVAALLALHPFVTYPFSLRILAAIRGRKVPNNSASLPRSATIMISARNEASVISQKLLSVKDAIRQVDAVDFEIMLFADGCSDKTAELACDIIGETNVIDGGCKAGGKTEAMNAMARRAKGEVLVLTDANSMLDPLALKALLKGFRDPGVGAVLGSSLIETGAGPSNGLSDLLSRYWRFEESLRALETDVGSTIGGDGALYGVRATLWPYPEPDIIDDFFVPMSVLISGKRVVFAPDAIIREASVTQLRDEAPRKYRIAARALRAHRALHANLSKLDLLHRYMYLSHKVLKWMMGLNALFAAMLASVGLGLAGYGMVTAVGILAFAALLLLGARWPHLQPAGKVFSASVSILQVTRGAMFGLSGGSITNWTPPLSDRRVPK